MSRRNELTKPFARMFVVLGRIIEPKATNYRQYSLVRRFVSKAYICHRFRQVALGTMDRQKGRR